MMSYEEATAEIRRRRDAEIQRRKNNRKKLAITLCAFVLCLSVGAGAWMISRDGGTPFPDITDTTETDGILIEVPDLPDWTPAPYACDDEHEHDGEGPNSAQCTYPPVYVNELMDTDEMCEVNVDTPLPAKFPVYVTTDKCGVTYENYTTMAHKEITRFAKLLYGDGYDESKQGGDSYFPDDPYIELNPNGEPLMKANIEWVRVPIEITRVEEYRDMSYREALEYVTSTKYYKAIVEYLDLEKVTHSGLVSTNIYGQNKYTYKFIFASPKTDLEDGMLKYTDKYISAAMTFNRTDDGGKITIEYWGCHSFSKDSVLFEKEVEGTTVPVAEAIERARENLGVLTPEINDEVRVFIEYRNISTGKWNEPYCFVPYYVIYFGLESPEAGCTMSERVSVRAVDGIDDYLAGK